MATPERDAEQHVVGMIDGQVHAGQADSVTATATAILA